MNNANDKNSSHGRMTFDKNQKSVPDYPSFAEDRSSATGYEHDVSKGNITSTPVSQLFFSDVNINALQQGISNMVLNKSCGKQSVGKQSSNELLIIMRAIYLSDSINSFIDVVGQVKKLNETVLMYCVPRIMNELEMHNRYMKDITSLPVPLRYGESTSLAGTKTLELKSFF